MLQAPLSLSLPIPGPAARQQPTNVWSTGFSLVDAFFSLKRGQFTLLSGESGTGKSDVAVHAFVTALLSEPAALGVLGLVGLSRRANTEIVEAVCAAGLSSRVTVVASSGSIAC